MARCGRDKQLRAIAQAYATASRPDLAKRVADAIADAPEHQQALIKIVRTCWNLDNRATWGDDGDGSERLLGRVFLGRWWQEGLCGSSGLTCPDVAEALLVASKPQASSGRPSPALGRPGSQRD